METAQVGGIHFANEGHMSHLNACKGETTEMYAYFWKKACTKFTGYIQ